MKCSKIIIFLSVLFLLGQVAFAKTYLVSVGTTKNLQSYDLPLATNDAKAIDWAYSHTADAECVLLLDSEGTVSNIKSKMAELWSKAKEDDTVIFYYSGHGYHGGIVVYDSKISYDEIRAEMAKGKSKNKIIILECCFSANFTQANNSQSSVHAADDANVMLFLACRGGEYARGMRSDRNSYFTTYLEKGLRGYADSNKDRIVTAKELYDYVSPKVVERSEGEQHPVMWGKFSQSMPVIRY